MQDTMWYQVTCYLVPSSLSCAQRSRELKNLKSLIEFYSCQEYGHRLPWMMATAIHTTSNTFSDCKGK